MALFAAALGSGTGLAHAVAAEPPQSAESSLEQGREALRQKRYGPAMRLLSDAIRKDPNQVHAWRLRAQVHEHLGRLHLAVQDYERYLALRPSDSDAYVRRGDLLNRTLEHESAIQDYTRALKLKPSQVGALVGRGLALTALERYPEALDDYRRALAFDPANGEVLGNIAIAYLLSGERGKAAQYMKKALQVEKDPAWKARLESWLTHLESRRHTKTPDIPPAETPPPATKPLW